MMKKVLIFDFDGVLANTMQLHLKLSRKFFPDVTEQDHINHGKSNPMLKPAIRYEKEHYPIYFDMYNKRVVETEVYPLYDFLKKYNDRTIVICSSSPREGIENFLSAKKISEFIDDIYDVHINPSKVEKLQMIMDKYDAKPEDCIFVTDTVGDINEAKKLNIDAIGVTWGLHSREILEKAKPLAIIDTIEELDVLIQ